MEGGGEGVCMSLTKKHPVYRKQLVRIRQNDSESSEMCHGMFFDFI